MNTDHHPKWYNEYPSIPFVVKFASWLIVLGGLPLLLFIVGNGLYHLFRPAAAPSLDFSSICPYLR